MAIDRIPGLYKKGGAGSTAAAIATQGQAEGGTNDTAMMTPLKVAEAIVALGQNFKNVCGRNGGFEVWQRLVNAGTTIAVAASTVAYTVDGWYLATAANEASTITQVTGLATGSSFAARVQRNSGQTGTGAMVFAIPLDTDELAKLRNRTAVLSFWVATGANWSPTSGTLTWKLYCGTGAVAKRNATGYTSESNPISGSVNLSQSAAAALQMSAISSSIGSSITQAELQFTWTPTGTAGANDWFSIDDVQLEVCLDGIAPVTPTFERTDYILDLMRCRRHLMVWNATSASLPVLGFGLASSTTSMFANYVFQQQTRAPITGITVSSAGHFVAYDPQSGTNRTLTSLVFSNGSNEGTNLSGSAAASSFTLGQGVFLTGNNAAAQILFTGAEI